MAKERDVEKDSKVLKAWGLGATLVAIASVAEFTIPFLAEIDAMEEEEEVE